MRLVSSAFLRRAAAMAAPSSYSRRSYPHHRRGYSDSPSRRPGGGAELVSGDAHLSAVRATNESLRRGGGSRGPPPPYWQEPRYHQPQYGYDYGYSYGYGQAPQPGPPYGFVPYNYGHPQQQQPPPPPPPPGPHYGPYGYAPRIRTCTGTRSRSRTGARQRVQGSVLAHRRCLPGWQITVDCGGLQSSCRHAKLVLSYNILADYLAHEHRVLYVGIPSFMLDWNWRKNKLLQEFSWWSPDILCLQEVDKFTDLEQEMAREGYNGIWKMRTGKAADGCAIFWKTTRFQLCHEEDIEFNKLGLRDNVAQLCVLESVVPRNVQTDSTNLSTSSSNPQQAKQVVICNIHVLYNPKRGDIKLGQVRTLLDRAYTLSKMWNNAPVILCGDFNSTPKSPLYNFVSEQKLNLSGLAKNIISGQQTSVSPQGLYTGPNVSRFHSPVYPSNYREGNTTLLNDRKPQTETAKLVDNSSPAGTEPVIADTSSESFFDSKSSNSCGNNIPCSGSSNLDEQGLSNSLEGPVKDACASYADEGCTPIDKPSERCFGPIKIESGEESDTTYVPSAPATVCAEIIKSGSCEIADSSQLLSSDHLPDNVIPEEDQLSAVSKDKLHEKENAIESTSAQENCATNEPESSHFNGSQNVLDAIHQMSNVRLEGESGTGLAEPANQSNGAISYACGNQYTAEVINKHSVSCRDESEDNARAVQDDITTDEVICTDVNSDPSFFEELSGGSSHLFEGEDHLPATSHSLSSQQMVSCSQEYYHHYDPYRWTPEEIKAATGKDECTCMEHSLKLRSVYTDVEDFVGTKDTNKEPLVTSYNRKFMGTVDYIWASEDLHTVTVLDTFPKEILQQTIGFPTKKWGSDHIALACELAFTK
ncbi:hypothetical protein U9M48_018465 [Paspalum notatum var. saurae]|uniref:Endonuclease/exonuclease/phosphatase domain-containing protein n=1 Tax=Paspalum notatum var. saurae TaxID=547442 RepID=A0AAQ3WQJ4_PASNO